ncbi:MAG: hypothetical protein ACFFD7_11985 [Candidatus Thorarchaeota archaeon]
MSPIIEEFWIFSKDGNPYVNFYHKNSGKNQFKLRAINSDIKILDEVEPLLKASKKILSNAKVEFLELNEFKLVITPCLNNYLLLICRSGLKTKNKQIQNTCKIICRMINSLYFMKDFRTWDGDIALFDKLSKKIDLYFKMSNL